MPTEKISFGNKQESSNEELAGAMPLAINVLVDDRGTVRRRPGIKSWDAAGTSVYPGWPIVGITEAGDTLYFVAEPVPGQRYVGKLHNGVQTQLTFGYGSQLDGSARPEFAVFADRVMIAGGATLLEVGLTATAANFVSNDADVINSLYFPPACSTVDAFGGYALVNDLTSVATQNQVRFSGTGLAPDGLGNNGIMNFDALDFLSADARPDSVVALANNSNEFFVFGKQTTQVFALDASGFGVLAPVRTNNVGMSAQHSLVRTPEGFLWLDHRRRIMQSDGRDTNDISSPIRATLSSISTVSDCWGGYAPLNQGDFYFWVFPSDGRTFCAQSSSGFSQWHSGSKSLSLWSPTAYHYWEDQGVHVVGLPTGQLAMLDMDTPTDLDYLFRVEVRTGFLDHKTSAYKTCQSLRLRFHRTAAGTPGVVRVSWRDNLGALSTPIEIDLSSDVDYEPTVQLRGLGTYRQRQWHIDLTDAVNIALADAEEEFTVT